MSDCIFCKIIKGEISSTKIYEDEKVLAFLDINPINPGHTLIIPKVHSQDLLEVTEDDLISIIKVVNKVVPAVLKGVEAKGFNLGVNNGAVAGQAVNHLHFHIMPRFENDCHKLWSGKPYKEGEIDEVAEKIKNNL